MSISLWKAEQLGKENFALGAASRDAEVAELKREMQHYLKSAKDLLKENYDLITKREDGYVTCEAATLIEYLRQQLASRDAEIADLKVVSDHNLTTCHQAAQKLREQVTTQSVDIERLLTAIARCKELITEQGRALAATEPK